MGNANSGRRPNEPYRNRKMEIARDRIKATTLINRLAAHAAGKIEMTPTQVQAAQILLKKVLPDLAAVDNHVTGQMTQHYVRAPAKISNDDWAKFLEAKRAALPAETAAVKAKVAAQLKAEPKPKLPDYH